MNDWIGNIFYFGSPKDGFRVYPDLGAASNVFYGYYSNTETDWILMARKTGDITRYTYVKYGLLTALIEGRTGSCFGISIDFVNHYFTDLKVFRTEIFEGIWGAILDERQLLEAQESSGKVAFRSYDLYDVAPYLDEMSKKIGEVLRDKKYSNYVRPSHEIPEADDNPIYGLHPDSSPAALKEYFRTYGVIKLSPKLPIETKSASEKKEEQREQLEKIVSKLTEQLGQKEREVQALNQKIEEFQGLVKPIRDFFETQTNKTDSYFGNSRRTNQPYEPLSPPNQKASFTETGHNPSSKDNLSPKAKRIALGLAILLGVFVVLSIGYLFKGESKQEVEKPRMAQPASQPSPTIVLREPLLIVRKNGKELGLLNEVAFLEDASGKTIYDEADFKEALTSFLFQKSSEVVGIYNGNKDELWDWILKSNPNNREKITQYLKRGTFKIEINTEQQAMLKELVVFIKSS
jgi:hypothetical protein